MWAEAQGVGLWGQKGAEGKGAGLFSRQDVLKAVGTMRDFLSCGDNVKPGSSNNQHARMAMQDERHLGIFATVPERKAPH